MKKIIFSLFVLGALSISCKNDNKNNDSGMENSESAEDSTSVPQQIAYANGFENFKDINELDFTFNVKVNDTLRSSRSWKWFPKEDRVEMVENSDSLIYKRSEKMEDSIKPTDSKFVNDSYWLLFPYQLVWSDFEQEYKDNATAPISQNKMQSLNIKYTNDKGYTPGDSYQIYFDDEDIIKEWTYTSADGKILTTTWEDYQNYKGLNISKMHKSEDGKFQLYFTDIKVK